MFEYIILGVIIALASIYIYRYFKKDSSSCDTCKGSCKDCSFKNDIKDK